MKKDSGALSEALKILLEEKLPRSEVQSLKDEGFTLKRPTRETALAVAIYKKAASGDLSAIKELRSILSGFPRLGDAAWRKLTIIVGISKRARNADKKS